MKPLDLGDLGAFAHVYRSTAGLVRGILARVGVRDAAIDDAIQDVFVVAYRRRAEFDPERPLEPWLVGIARRIGFRYRRSSARGQRKLAALQWASVDADADHPAGLLDARRFLEQFLATLKEDRRAVFVLSELHGLTGPEIAARLQIPLDTAYTRLRAARRELERALLVASDDPPPSPVALHSGWLLLLPRLGEPAAPGVGGWLLATVVRGRVAVGLLALTAIVAAPVLATAPAPVTATVKPVVTRSAARPVRAAAQPTSLAPPASPASLAPPPPNSRLEQTLAGAPTLPAAPRDRLGAADLARALEVLADDPTTALVRLDRHARSFPDSALARERGLARVRALCSLGRAAEASAQAATLADAGRIGAALADTCVDKKIFAP